MIMPCMNSTSACDRGGSLARVDGGSVLLGLPGAPGCTTTGVAPAVCRARIAEQKNPGEQKKAAARLTLLSSRFPVASLTRHSRDKTMGVRSAPRDAKPEMLWSQGQNRSAQPRRLWVPPSLMDVRAALGGWSVYPAIRLGRIVGNELNGDG